MSDEYVLIKEDIKLLGDLLGSVILEQEGGSVYQAVEYIRQQAIEARQHNSRPEVMDDLSEYLKKLPEEKLLSVARAFNQFLNFANIAEQHNRVRNKRERLNEEVSPKRDSIQSLLPRLFEHGIDQAEIEETLNALSIELVLTAHPTEISRRSLIQKYDAINDVLVFLDRSGLTRFEREQAKENLHRHIISVWCSDEIRRSKPTPIDEAKWGFITIEQTLWQAVPDYLRELESVVYPFLGKKLPTNFAPIKFASWMGGDRDGNPNVTAKITQEVCYLSHWMAMDLYLRDIDVLYEELSVGPANKSLLEFTDERREPYRAVLKEIKLNIEKTKLYLEAKLENEKTDEPCVYRCRDDLRAPLMLLHQSLCDCGLDVLADGALTDTLRRLACFGVTLLRLDIRQEADRHAAVINGLTQYLGVGEYACWNEQDKQVFLLGELSCLRPLMGDGFYESEFCTAEIKEVLDTFSVISSLEGEALGAYVISMAGSPSDVLAVMLLQKTMGVRTPMRVVPLFETLDDLNGAAESAEQLLSLDWYRNVIAGKQEIMIGYSDSAKGAGYLAASWAQYQAQEALLIVCKKYDIHLTLFHGRGGSISRGGSPAHSALLSQPPGTVKGTIRVTEQGEVIRFKFGQHGIAVRNLDIYLSATLEATLLPPPNPTAEWRNVMERLTQTSLQGYRAVVDDHADFSEYMDAVTPGRELQKLALGSRPAKRASAPGITSLRAIPWVFGWTQVRLMLPAWLGTGDALVEAMSDSAQAVLLLEMKKKWPYFETILAMLEMVIAKADMTAVSYYEQNLDPKDLLLLGEYLKSKCMLTADVLKQINGYEELLDNNPLMKWSVSFRNPYIDPLHLLQAELIRRTRDESVPGNAVLDNALKVTIAGIAAGMRNTG